MNQYTFNYIITIHNKENLISDVIRAVIRCAGKNSTIYPILDGCTDKTEMRIDTIVKKNPDLQIKKIYAPDVHEIRSLNLALKHIPQEGRVLNIVLQDDVILEDIEIERKLTMLYDHLGFGTVGTLGFRHGVNLVLDHKNKQVREIDLIESVFGTGMSHTPLLPNQLIQRMVSVRSPECISSHVIKHVGIFDEALSPYMWDNHDLSIRCLKKDLKNYVFGLAFHSDIQWGGMRSNPHPELNAIDIRNRKYLYDKHFDFLSNESKKPIFLKNRIAKPSTPEPLRGSGGENVEEALRAYKERRAALHSQEVQLYVSDSMRKIKYALLVAIIRLKIIIIEQMHTFFRKTRYKIRLLFTNPRKLLCILKDMACLLFTKRIDTGYSGARGTTDAEIKLLKRYAQSANVGIVEIGVLDGGTTKEMADVADVPIYGIDPLIPDSMNKRLIGTEEKITRNLSQYESFNLVKDFSYNVARNWEHPFDFIFIDGDHTYNAVKRDFEDWYHLIDSGGHIALHDSAKTASVDTGDFDGWPGCIQLAQELREDPRVSFVEVCDSITVFQKNDM